MELLLNIIEEVAMLVAGLILAALDWGIILSRRFFWGNDVDEDDLGD